MHGRVEEGCCQTLPRAGLPLDPQFLTWVLSLWLWILSAWVLTPLRTKSVGTGVLILPALLDAEPRLRWCLLHAWTCFSSTFPFTWTLQTVSSASWMSSSSSVLPCRHCLSPLPRISRILAFVSCPCYFPLLTCCPNTHWPQLSPVVLQCLVCPYFWSWLSWPVPSCCWSYLNCKPHGIDFQGKKFSSVSLCGLAKHVKAYAMTEGLCQGSNKEVCRFPEEDYL